MKRYPILLLAAGLIALAGCSSTPSRVDTGVIRARTFSFVNLGSRPAPAQAESRQAVHAATQEAIARSLASRGVTQVQSAGDVTVQYLFIVGDGVSVASLTEYFGYGEDAAALQDKAHTAHTASKNPNYFAAGTLVIDLVDSKTFKLLKRGYATRPLLKDPSPDERAAHIQGVVDEIFAGLRFAQ